MKKKDDIILPPVLKAMADMTRLKILLMLESKPRMVGEIVSFFNLSQPTITRHLQTLMGAGLVKRTRQGQHVCYELNTDSLRSTCASIVACFPCCGIELKMNGELAVCDLDDNESKDKLRGSKDTPQQKIIAVIKKKGGKK